jgi:hypothetical protein
MTTEVPVDAIVDTYIRIRDAKDMLTNKYKAEVAELDEQMAVLKHKLLDLSKETGITSFSTSNATAYRTVKNRYWTNDWESFYGFMQENAAMELLEKRIHQANMKEFVDQHPDLHPPGLNVDSEYEITIRRK